MKNRKRIVWLLLAALLTTALAGCGITENAEPVTDTPNDETTETVQTEMDCMAIYAPAFEEIADVLINGYDWEKEYEYVPSGVIEMAMWSDTEELLRSVGYTMEDVSGDGIPELLVGMTTDGMEANEGNEILGGFTCKDGETVTFLDGWARNRYEYLGGGRFFNSGSSGAAHSAFGAFRIKEDGTELICEDFYFTDDVSDFMDPNYDGSVRMHYYHNTTGSWEPEDSEELEITDDEFWQIAWGYEDGIRQIALTPFAEYPGLDVQALSGGGQGVRVDYLNDVEGKLGDALMDARVLYPDLFPTDAAYETIVVFRTDEDVENFRLLSLELQDVDASGKAVFSATEVFELAELSKGIPLLVPMRFPGDIPNNGFSYEKDGETKQFSISVSGKDGALEVSPID